MTQRVGTTHRVGTRVLFENDRVRVWEMRLKPGEASERHVHESDYLFVNLSEADITLYPEDGPPESSHVAPLRVVYTEVGGGITHRLRGGGSVRLTGRGAGLHVREYRSLSMPWLLLSSLQQQSTPPSPSGETLRMRRLVFCG